MIHAGRGEGNADAATVLGLKYNDAPQAVKAEIDKFWNALVCIEITPEHMTAKECIELVRRRTV